MPHGTISLTLRKHQDTVVPLREVNERYRTEGWAEWRSERTVRNLDRPMAAYAAGDFENFLRVAVQEHLNILFAGPTGVGKTTLGKSVIDAIDRSERVITIEDTEELGGLPPNHVRLLYAKHDAGFGHEELLQTTMGMRPKRIILGELRDDAAMTWVKYICTGHPGAVTTIHGSSAGEAFRRLYQLVKSTPDGVAIDARRCSACWRTRSRDHPAARDRGGPEKPRHRRRVVCRRCAPPPVDDRPRPVRGR